MNGDSRYPTKESLVIISGASSKVCSARADLPGSPKPCVETPTSEDGVGRHSAV